jgi:UDP-N-acetylglucosamine--N-acetylmuramyl-(pentapeptide) pyrophosphoryl-undecaprenol N-acetylglucosamine transferase
VEPRIRRRHRTQKLRAFKPDVVFSTGGYGSFPCSVAARLLRKPLVVYLPDVTPGWAVSAEKRLATRMTTTTETALKYLPRKKTVVTGYPVRKAFFTTSRSEARRELGLNDDQKVVVVAGASQGAHAINEAVFAAIPAIAREATVFHVSGASDLPRAVQLRNELPPEQTRHYQVTDFRNDLPIVMLAADLASSAQAPASSGGRGRALGPHSRAFAGGHQRDNAAWLNRRARARPSTKRRWTSTQYVLDLLTRHQAAGRHASRSQIAPSDAADRIADVIVEWRGDDREPGPRPPRGHRRRPHVSDRPAPDGARSRGVRQRPPPFRAHRQARGHGRHDL